MAARIHPRQAQFSFYAGIDAIAAQACSRCGRRVRWRPLLDGRERPCDPNGRPHVCPTMVPVWHVVRGQDAADDPLFASIERQLAARRWTCPGCGGAVHPFIGRGGLRLRCQQCRRDHLISIATCNATLRELGVRCGACGAEVGVRREGRADVVGCSRYPHCRRHDTWEVVHGRLRSQRQGKTTGNAAAATARAASSQAETSPQPAAVPTSLPRAAEPFSIRLERSVEQIWRKVHTERVQQFGWRVIVELDVRQPDPVCLIAIRDAEDVSGRLTVGGKVVWFDRNATPDSIRQSLQPWYQAAVPKVARARAS